MFPGIQGQKEGQRWSFQFRCQGKGAACHGQTARQFHDGEIAAARQMFQNAAQRTLLRVARIRFQAKAADAAREQIRRTQELHPYPAGIHAGQHVPCQTLPFRAFRKLSVQCGKNADYPGRRFFQLVLALPHSAHLVRQLAHEGRVQALLLHQHQGGKTSFLHANHGFADHPPGQVQHQSYRKSDRKGG